MKSKREESFSKIQGESFYTSPPYNYRPSIVEYLTNLNVTKKGFIADIMHMDYKGNLKINSIKEDSFQITLIDNKELNLNEILIWDYLKSLENRGQIILYINKIKKSVLSEFSALVRIKTSQKFKPENLEINYNKENINSYRRALFLSRIFVGFFLTFPFLPFIVFLAGFAKLSKQTSDIKLVLRKFVWKYFLISLIYQPFMLFTILSIFSLMSLRVESSVILPVIILIILIGVFLFYQYSKLSYDYISWLLESKEASEHRKEWMKFKNFVVDNSEIENQSLAHYVLWGPFYYYTLAVGGIKEEI